MIAAVAHAYSEPEEEFNMPSSEATNDPQFAQLQGEVTLVKTKVGHLQEQTTEIKSEVKRLDSHVSDIKLGVVEIKSRVTHLQNHVAEIKTDLRDFKKDVSAQFERIDKKFVDMDKKFDGKFEGLDKKVSDLISSVNSAKIWALVLFGGLVAVIVSIGGTVFKLVPK